tara:strand:- start:618 stop:1448 length:831 start_codon:yes stop_codon:yes gene_type:complete
MADITEKIEKQMEGTNLALAAVAEVLQKMDVRLSKEEEASAVAQRDDANASARAELVKSIANEVINVIKEDSGDAGLDISGKERKAKATGGTPQNSDDSESAVSPDTKIESQQNTILAMKKLLKEYENGEEEDDEEEEKGYARKADDDAEDEAADMPVEEKGEDDDEEEDEDDAVKSMRKQIAKMKKQLDDAENGMQKAVATESEDRLRKMGFREETGLKAPQLLNGLGVDNTPIVKAAAGDTAEQLADLSYTELRRLQTQIEMGDTDGVPKELLG